VRTPLSIQPSFILVRREATPTSNDVITVRSQKTPASHGVSVLAVACSKIVRKSDSSASFFRSPFCECDKNAQPEFGLLCEGGPARLTAACHLYRSSVSVGSILTLIAPEILANFQSPLFEVDWASWLLWRRCIASGAIAVLSRQNQWQFAVEVNHHVDPLAAWSIQGQMRVRWSPGFC